MIEKEITKFEKEILLQEKMAICNLRWDFFKSRLIFILPNSNFGNLRLNYLSQSFLKFAL